MVVTQGLVVERGYLCRKRGAIRALRWAIRDDYPWNYDLVIPRTKIIVGLLNQSRRLRHGASI